MTETRMVTSFDGTRLRVLDNGMVNAVRTILFLHNFGGSADSWAWVNNFLPNDMRVICLDQRGFGESAAQPEPTTFTVDDMAADAIEVASHCGLGKYTLVGHSMGGKSRLCRGGAKSARFAGCGLARPVAADARTYDGR